MGLPWWKLMGEKHLCEKWWFHCLQAGFWNEKDGGPANSNSKSWVSTWFHSWGSLCHLQEFHSALQPKSKGWGKSTNDGVTKKNCGDCPPSEINPIGLMVDLVANVSKWGNCQCEQLSEANHSHTATDPTVRKKEFSSLFLLSSISTRSITHIEASSLPTTSLHPFLLYPTLLGLKRIYYEDQKTYCLVSAAAFREPDLCILAFQGEGRLGGKKKEPKWRPQRTSELSKDNIA